MGIKQTLHPINKTYKPRSSKTYKRASAPTKADKVLVAQFVANNAGTVSPKQETALAVVLKHSKEFTRKLIDDAREKFLARASDYVDIHMENTKNALLAGQEGDAKAMEVAARSSQWAIENISEDGTRIVEREKTESDGSKIMIGVQIAGMIGGK